MNRKLLRTIFKDIIEPTISNNSTSIKIELKLYLVRFAEKVMTLCLSDLDLTKSFLASIINLADKKVLNTEGASKYNVHNLSFFSQRVL